MPVPAVMVSCGEKEQKPNIITVAWVGTVCSEPPIISVSIRPSRHSASIIDKTGELVVNIPSLKQARATDLCGVISGRDKDKFKEAGLTPASALKVGCPIIAECPIGIECKVIKRTELGTHVMYLAEVVAVQVTTSLLRKNKLEIEKAGLFAYAHGNYHELGRLIGHFGFSVRKKK